MQQESKTIRDFVYSSEMKIRDKFSLKNLLAEDTGLERNYVSQQSSRVYRNTVRPQTMYGERVRMLINDETKKIKMQTQIKLKRQQSSYKIIRTNSGTQVKSITQEDKIKMKKALGKINLLATDCDIKFNEQQELQIIFHFISCLAQVDNHYQSAFQYLFKRMKQLVFPNNYSQIGTNVKSLADKTKNQFLINFSYRNLGKITYENLCRQLLKQTQKAVSYMQAAQTKQTSGQQKNLQIIKQKQQLIKKVKRQLKYYQQHPSQDLYPYVKKLQREAKQMKQQIQQLLHLKGQNQYSIQIYQASNLLLSQQIESLKGKIYEMELQQLSGLKNAQKNSQLKLFEQNVQNLKEMLDKSKLKMQGMKQQFDKLKQQNQNLINQRSILAKRAAVGFGQLTPRPNIKNIFAANNLIYQNYINLSKKNLTTQNIMKSLIEKLRNYENSQGKKVLNNNISIQQKNQSDQQMKNAINFIDQTKNQVKKTIESVQDVKKSINRQRSQKQSLDRKIIKK